MDASLNLILSFNVIAPLFFLMVIGYVLVHGTKLADKELCSKANALVFKVFLPCMLFKNIYQSDIKTQMKGRTLPVCCRQSPCAVFAFVLYCPKDCKAGKSAGSCYPGDFPQ